MEAEEEDEKILIPVTNIEFLLNKKLFNINNWYVNIPSTQLTGGVEKNV